MKTLKLKQVEHKVKIGKECPDYEPNITEDCLLEVEGSIVGFYIKDISKYSPKLSQLATIANKEFRSDNVPKQEMSRGPQGTKLDKLKRQLEGHKLVTQFSTILGSVAPKPHMRRPYPTISSVHRKKKSKAFIRAMWACAIESEKLIKKFTPKVYKEQVRLFKDVPKKWRFGNLFTSSISNFNIAANYHRDAANLVGCVNVIITKRNDCRGGCLNVPDYDVTFASGEDSMIVYPAWKNVHGVTPIHPLHKKGYRNSLIFYPLKAFAGLD
jgi:hypothetical protein